jgi:hypothetical protein
MGLATRGLKNRKEREKRENKFKLREKIDEDYDNNIKNINKLITLDAQIKKDNAYQNSNSKRDDSKSNISERRSKSKKRYDSKDYHNRNNDYQRRNYSKRKENRNNEESPNNENRSNVIVNDPALINVLLTEVRALSNKQISLLDLMDEIQSNTQQEIESLNQKIYDLDTVVKDLNHQLFYLQKDND